jgi:hypothetical protein
MITPDSVARLARMQGFPDDVQVTLEEPGATNAYAHTIVAVRGSLLVRKPILWTPSLGEIAKALSDVLRANEWLQ